MAKWHGDRHIGRLLSIILGDYFDGFGSQSWETWFGELCGASQTFGHGKHGDDAHSTGPRGSLEWLYSSLVTAGVVLKRLVIIDVGES